MVEYINCHKKKIILFVSIIFLTFFHSIAQVNSRLKNRNEFFVSPQFSYEQKMLLGAGYELDILHMKKSYISTQLEYFYGLYGEPKKSMACISMKYNRVNNNIFTIFSSIGRDLKDNKSTLYSLGVAQKFDLKKHKMTFSVGFSSDFYRQIFYHNPQINPQGNIPINLPPKYVLWFRDYRIFLNLGKYF